MIAPAPGSGLVLRDIHVPPAPPWWPPAPGWWILAAIVVLAAMLASVWAWRRHRRRAALRRLFDDTITSAPTPAPRTELPPLRVIPVFASGEDQDP